MRGKRGRNTVLCGLFRVAIPKTQWQLQRCPGLYSAAQNAIFHPPGATLGYRKCVCTPVIWCTSDALPSAALPLTSSASTLHNSRVNPAVRPLLRALSPHARRRDLRQACLAKKLLALSWSPVTVGPLSPRRQSHCLSRHRKAPGRQRVNGGQLQRWPLVRSANREPGPSRCFVACRRSRMDRSPAQGLRFMLPSSRSRWRTGQHDAKMPLMHRQHHNPTVLWSRMHPKTLSLIVRFNRSVPTGLPNQDR